MEGHSAELVLERKLYGTVAQLPFVRTICEIGFNAGHSAAMWLLANPRAKVVMFDMFTWKYSGENADFLRQHGARYGLVDVEKRLITV